MENSVLVETFGYNEKLFNQLSFSYQQSDKIGIVGDNGVGKTTFFKILSNQLKTKTIKLENKFDFGYFDSSFALNNQLSFEDNVKLYKKYLDRETISNLTDVFEFNKYKNLRISKLSKGNFVKAHLIFLFALDKTFYFLDEPFTNLDEKSKSKLVEILKISDFGFILISHDNDTIVQCCKQVCELKDKQLNPLITT